MNIDNVIRKMERKSKLITVRVTPTVFNFLKAENVSHTGLFDEAVRNFMNFKRRK